MGVVLCWVLLYNYAININQGEADELAMVIQCSGFQVIVQGKYTYFQTPTQTARLIGNRKAIERLIYSVNHSTKLYELMSLFYNKDDDGYSTEQVITYTSCRRIVENDEQSIKERNNHNEYRLSI